MSTELRAARFSVALAAFRKRGGSVRGLAKASGVAGANIYRAQRDGTGLGRETVAKLAPVLGVSADYLLGFVDEPGQAPAPEAAMVAWIRSVPRALWPDLRKYGDALAAGYKAKHADTPRAADNRGTSRRTSSKAPKR